MRDGAPAMPKEDITLRAGDLSLRLGCHGGVILDFRLGDRPLMRPATPGAVPGDSACYPLVPLGNRIRDNRFAVGGTEYRVTPNAPPEPLNLHGAGWQAHWTAEMVAESAARLSHGHDGPHLPHRYLATQDFVLTATGLRMVLSVTNTGDSVLPFGLGWHPFFPGGARLTAPARDVWTEGGDHLPGECGNVPADLDFTAPRPLPPRWLNNAFGGWSGHARIDWPATGLSLELAADALFGCYQLYQPAAGGVFALEPMSHLPGALALPGLGGLRLLAPGERLAGGLTLSPHSSPDHSGDPAGGLS